jgi:hypothetical protein
MLEQMQGQPPARLVSMVIPQDGVCGSGIAPTYLHSPRGLRLCFSTGAVLDSDIDKGLVASAIRLCSVFAFLGGIRRTSWRERNLAQEPALPRNGSWQAGEGQKKKEIASTRTWGKNKAK